MLHAPAVRLSPLATLVVTTLVGVVALLPLTACTASVTTEPGGGSTATSTSYEDLVALFQEWREFEKPARPWRLSTASWPTTRPG